jgi:hypothetical protein
MYKGIALDVSVRLIILDCLNVVRILRSLHQMDCVTPCVTAVSWVHASVLFKSMFVCHLQRFVLGSMLASSGSP